MSAVAATTADDAADTALRAARRDRLFDAMAGVGLDALVLGRRDSVAYATGLRSLWTAATRPFAAASVLVGAGRATHLLSTWDEGVPPEVPFEHLYGITWSPAVMAASVGAIPGLVDVRRIGVEALSPGFEHMLRRLAPGAEVVPADDLLRAVRALKLPAEVERIRSAVAVAREAVEAAGAALGGGLDPVAARGAALRAAAERGVTMPGSGVVVQPVGSGAEPVHVDVGLLVDGYEGGMGRTVSLGDAGDAGGPRDDAAVDAQRRLLDACRPGATGVDVRDAVAGVRADRWMVRGSGMGFEPPVVTDALGTASVIDEAMVLSVEVELDGWRRRDLAVVGPTTTEAL